MISLCKRQQKYYVGSDHHTTQNKTARFRDGVQPHTKPHGTSTYAAPTKDFPIFITMQKVLYFSSHMMRRFFISFTPFFVSNEKKKWFNHDAMLLVSLS